MSSMEKHSHVVEVFRRLPTLKAYVWLRERVMLA